jgi:hypothetical protein
MDTFFDEFEQASLACFKLYPEDQKERIVELYTQETAAAQAKLEEGALLKWESEKKAEETKAAEEAKKPVDPKAKKAAPPAKKGKDGDKPQLDVAKLAVPAVAGYVSSMEQKYCIERSITDIADKLMLPAPTDENGQDADNGEKVEIIPDLQNSPAVVEESKAIASKNATPEDVGPEIGEEGEGEGEADD